MILVTDLTLIYIDWTDQERNARIFPAQPATVVRRPVRCAQTSRGEKQIPLREQQINTIRM